jgi:hypothetical protein
LPQYGKSEPDMNGTFSRDCGSAWHKSDEPRRSPMTKAFLILLILGIAPATAAAAVRTWVSPELDGERVSSCLADRSSCGKPAADLWCKSMGFDQALTFERERAALDFTRLPDTGELAPGTPFRQIKCSSARVDSLPTG